MILLARLGISVEDTNSADFAFTTNGANDGKYPVRAKLELRRPCSQMIFWSSGPPHLGPDFNMTTQYGLVLVAAISP